MKLAQPGETLLPAAQEADRAVAAAVSCTREVELCHADLENYPSRKRRRVGVGWCRGRRCHGIRVPSLRQMHSLRLHSGNE